jgi:nucleoside-diphosphate-sugar epimerase
MNVLISGKRGFIGRAITRNMLEGGSNVYGVENPFSEKPPLQGELLQELKRGDIQSAVSGNNLHFEQIVHAANVYRRGGEDFNQSQMIDANVSLALDLAKIALQQDSPFLSFSSVFQWQNISTPYVESKREVDNILKGYQANGLHWRRFILGDTYGPGDTRDKLIPNLFEASIGNKRISLSHPKTTVRVTFIDDLMTLIFRATKDGAYIGTSQNEIALYELIELVERITGTVIDVNWTETEHRNSNSSTNFEMEALQSLDSIGEETSYEEGLRKVWCAITA